MELNNQAATRQPQTTRIPNLHIPRRPVIDAYDQYLSRIAAEMGSKEQVQRS
ncbi:MAG: hypothetical protein AB3N23_08455 [Paracoccaceae bacterium]